MQLAFVRHAEPVRHEVTEGAADPGLSERGQKQSERLAAWLADERVDEVWGSPARRAQETAAPLLERLGLSLRVHELLAEYDKDAASYVPIEELRRLNDDRWRALVEGRLSAGGTEVDHKRFVTDIVSAVDDIVAASPADHRVVIVCHGGVINCYIGSLLGIQRALWFEPRYTSISRVSGAPSGFRFVLTLNETAHLRGADLL